ncbi:type II toxin-antitoxin system prevent-host-death family antitoxin [Pseudomonas sp. TCU-HL1]|uniref:type II toxin-antitoxin system prevent-host-death family antitoxin n=1 Tax=Pseudomonas sp. TCU-HL1 TaxID=1856685 RepID=UPI000856F8CE|nr:type II toxin-antitoxin system prevent-host-death family antitoxin [Pseudomonas sp. TCU-HL1]AOE87402.1 hypothetical protein THL1_4854 [Pseudomonas sp. TCU-HL1]
MRVVNVSDARSNLKKVIDEVSDDSDFTIISRRNAPDAVLLSLDSFNSLMETVHLLKSPANAANLARSLAQLESEKTVMHELVEDDEQPPCKDANPPILADVAVSLTDFDRDPMATIRKGQGEAVVILNLNEPVFYVVPPARYLAMLEQIEDLRLAELVHARQGEPTVVVEIEELLAQSPTTPSEHPL